MIKRRPNIIFLTIVLSFVLSFLTLREVDAINLFKEETIDIANLLEIN